MANCPKCGEKIPPYNWSSKCKKCGIDMLSYGMEQRLDADEAKANAEWEKLDRLLASLKAKMKSLRKNNLLED